MYCIGQTINTGDLEGIAVDFQFPSMIGGDFYVELDEEDNFGGLDFTQQEATDFAHCIRNFALFEVKFSGSKYMWWDG